MTRHLVLLIAITIAFAANSTRAVEPNNTFGERTILGSGVLAVTDDLAPGSNGDFPDTMIASLNSAGLVTDFNDDGGTWEGSLGSGLSQIPINNDSSFWFIVTGNPDYDFTGSHDESGNYHVYVDIFNDFGEFEETIEFDDSLAPGEVDQFYLDGFNSFYSYNVEIDNTVGGSSQADVDFFTFTGLTVGATFTAEVTQSPFDGFDSYLGWFSDAGILLDADDDDGFETLSLLEGTVPANGQLTFAVTGFGDDDFLGDHDEEASYSLEITLGSVSHPGDFDNDDDVDGRDFLRWQRKQSPNNGSLGDLQAWQANYGYNGSLTAVQAVPEPATVMLLVVVTCAASLSRKRLKPS
jgi:hypothetical protein